MPTLIDTPPEKKIGSPSEPGRLTPPNSTTIVSEIGWIEPKLKLLRPPGVAPVTESIHRHPAFLFSPEAWAKRRISAIQDYSLLIWHAVANIFSSPRYGADLFIQMDLIGFGSLPIVILTGFFTGAVLALQSNSALSEFGALSMTATLVTKSMIKELGPVITGLMVSGRNASGIASELGSMKITDQIDAMRALGSDPIRKLVTPRIFGTIIMLFFLTVLSDAVGIGGGALVSVSLLGLDADTYLHTSYRCILYADLIQCLTKPLFFGFIISSVGCYFGMSTKGGTQGVGRSTTQAVVYASVFIIIVDFLIARVMIGFFGQ